MGSRRQLRRLLCRLPARPRGVLQRQDWWQPDLCRAVRKVDEQGRACRCRQEPGLLRLPPGRAVLGLLLWCLVRQGRGVRVPLQGGVTEPAITAAGAIASADAAVSASFARSPPSAAPSGAVPLVAALAAEAALTPISIEGRPGCGSHRRDCHWSLPRCRHWRCSYRQVYILLLEPRPLQPIPLSLARTLR